MAGGKACKGAPTLPDELIMDEILKRLPVKIVVSFRCVCRLWNSILSQSTYIQSVLNCNLSQIPDDDYLIVHRGITNGVSIISRSNVSEICMDNVPYQVNNEDLALLVGSVNGLVCIVYFSRMDGQYHFILWNPALNLSKKTVLSKDSLSKYPRDGPNMFGFGWNSVSNNYKIVLQSKHSKEAVVYSCAADSWTNIVDSKFFRHATQCNLCSIPSVIVKGVCYWECDSTIQLLKFDATNNAFTYLTVPCVGKDHIFVNLNDCLAGIQYAEVGKGILDVYFFNEECSVWSKMYTTNIGISDNISIKTCFRNGGMIVFHKQHQKYSFFDPKSNEIKGLACGKDCRYHFGNGFSYTPNLVALGGMKSLHL